MTENEKLDQIIDEQRFFMKGKVYTYSANVVEKDLEDYVGNVDIKRFKVDEVITWTVKTGEDAYNSLTAKIRKEDLYPAVIPSMIGRFSKAYLGFYLSDKKIFHVNRFVAPTGFEILAGNGVVEMEDGKLNPHIHIVISDQAGAVFGGHLYPGTIVEALLWGFLIKLEES